jgi:predicted transcriptional regulator
MSSQERVPWSEALLTFVQRYPGVHFREILRRLRIPLGTLDYHIYRLSRQGLLETRDVGGHRCVFPSHPVGQGPPLPEYDKTVLAVLRQPVTRAILLSLLLEGTVTAQKLAPELQVSASTLSYYLDRLEGLGLIDRGRSYPPPRPLRLNSPQEVRRILLANPPLPEALPDRWVRLWQTLRLG